MRGVMKMAAVPLYDMIVFENRFLGFICCTCQIPTKIYMHILNNVKDTYTENEANIQIFAIHN